jgi:tetrahydromethanopterin S-methyltransferase subunit A
MAVTISPHVRRIHALYDDKKEFVLDSTGYFLIRIIPETKIIEVGFCQSGNVVEIIITGKNPTEIYQTILREKIIDRLDHAAYLGRELQKAATALELGIAYVQDSELNMQGI